MSKEDWEDIDLEENLDAARVDVVDDVDAVDDCSGSYGCLSVAEDAED